MAAARGLAEGSLLQHVSAHVNRRQWLLVKPVTVSFMRCRCELRIHGPGHLCARMRSTE
jgi:hypothetical protein